MAGGVVGGGAVVGAVVGGETGDVMEVIFFVEADLASDEDAHGGLPKEEGLAGSPESGNEHCTGVGRGAKARLHAANVGQYVGQEDRRLCCVIGDICMRLNESGVKVSVVGGGG